MAYRLALPPELAKLHDVFHVSMLRRYRSDESHILLVQEIQVHEDFSYDEKPKAILAREVKQLRNIVTKVKGKVYVKVGICIS